ncbi:hypothetical protein [Bradyrhizobium sp. USDA 10063]
MRSVPWVNRTRATTIIDTRDCWREAVDDSKRLELIELLIREKARDKLEAQRTSDRVAMTAQTVARVLGTSRQRDNF